MSGGTSTHCVGAEWPEFSGEVALGESFVIETERFNPPTGRWPAPARCPSTCYEAQPTKRHITQMLGHGEEATRPMPEHPDSLGRDAAASAGPDPRTSAQNAYVGSADRVSIVCARLQHWTTEHTSWKEKLAWLAGSLLAFLVAAVLVIQSLDGPVISMLLLLVLVILIHEIGHYLAMCRFGYRNTRMFFIPLFGAAVSGHGIGIPIVQEAIVSLSGPLPGLLIGHLFGIGYLATRSDLLYQVANIFVVINGFNLLPLYPLDGGRYLLNTIATYSPKAATALQVAVALALVGVGILLPKHNLITLSMLALSASWRTHQINQIAQELMGKRRKSRGQDNRTIPDNAVRTIVDRLDRKATTLTFPKGYTEAVIEIWNTVTAERPTRREAFALMFVYGLAILSSPITQYVYSSAR